MLTVSLPSPGATGRFARQMGPLLEAPMLVTLTGELGTGKTTVVRGVLRALGVREAVTSPSFTLAQSYRGRGGLVLHHLDLYRLAPGDDVILFAWDDYLTPDAITFVEWPEAAEGVLPPPDLALHLEHVSPRARRAVVEAGEELEKRLAAALKAARLAVERGARDGAKPSAGGGVGPSVRAGAGPSAGPASADEPRTRGHG